MRTRLLFITSHYFYSFTCQALERIQLPCTVKVEPYDDFDHIVQVYNTHAGGYDACFVSGLIAKAAIEIGCPNISSPLVAFQVSDNGLYRAILRLAVESQSLDFSRIAMDFLLPLEAGYSVADFLELDNYSAVVSKTREQMQSNTAPHPSQIENRIRERIRELWEENKIDLVICQYSSLIPWMQEMGIPFRCPFLPDSQLQKLIEETLTRIELQQLHSNHPTIIQIFPRNTRETTAGQMTELEQQLRQFIRTQLPDCVIQNKGDCIVIITTLQILRFLTEDFRLCRISAYLESRLSFPVITAYGVGTHVPHAMNNVEIASREAKLLHKPFVVDTNGNLIGPLASGNPMVITPASLPDVSEIAKQCGLSSMTIQKLISMIRTTGSNKITTQELAQHFDTTIRNANRIILNLCKGKAATPVYTQPSHSRGRPIQVYALDFGANLSS